MFRPKKNFDRFKRSAARLGLPVSRRLVEIYTQLIIQNSWDNDELLELLAKLVAIGKCIS
jgi:branched-chain amino acid aminotransferase